MFHLNARCFCITSTCTSNLGFKIAPIGICIFNISRCMFHFLKTNIKCEWLYSSSINIIVMQILFHIKVYMQVSCFFYTCKFKHSECVTLDLHYQIHAKCMTWIYKVFILKLGVCRKISLCIPTFNPSGVVYLPTNWPLTSPPGPLSLSVTWSSLFPSPSDSRGRGREPPSTTEVKSLGWNRLSCCNFSGFCDSVAENNSFWSLNRIHTLF